MLSRRGAVGRVAAVIPTRLQPQAIPGALTSLSSRPSPSSSPPTRQLSVEVSANDVHVTVEGAKPDRSGNNLIVIALE